MKPTEILSNTDRTSWSRVAMVWRFYLPYTRKKLISFAAIAIISEVFILLSAKYEATGVADAIIKMLSTMLTVLIGCSALVFAKPKGRELQAMLPALGMEKCIVMIGYVTIIIPLIVSIPSVLAYCILGNNDPSVIITRSILGYNISLSVFAYSLLFLESIALSCLWGVVSTHNRQAMRNGLLAAGGFYLATMFLTGFISFVIGFYNGFSDHEIEFADQSNTLFTVLAIICGIYVIFALIKCCHAIKRGQY